MRARIFAALPGLLLMVGTSVGHARDPFPPINPKPADFGEIFRVIYAKDPETGDPLGEEEDDDTIPPYLEEAMCGGYKLGESIGQSLGDPGKIAKVTGLPGREGEPLGDLRSGMAKRIEQGGTQDDGFLYPDTAKGLGTLCISGQAKTTKLIWDEAQHKRVPKEYGYPYFEDPPCLWRLKDESISKQDPPPLMPDQFEEIKGPDEDGVERRLPHTPQNCTNMCDWLNEWQYYDCLKTVPVFDADGNYLHDSCSPELGGEWGWRFICSDHKAEIVFACDAGVSEYPAQWPNATGCAGDDCRCNGPHCIVTPPAPALDFSSDLPYASFYRNYNASYERGQVSTDGDGPDVNAVQDIPVACYGFYEEFDPKDRQTFIPDRRCIINIDVENRKNTQKGKAEYGQNSSLPDVDPVDPANFRPDGEELVEENGGDEKIERDAWYEKLGRAFSLLNERPLQEVYENDLTNVYLDTEHLDTSAQRATYQITPEEPVAVSNLLRAFDDSGEERTVVRWWQEQETEASELTRRPVVRLLLPSGWAFGADPKDPLFTGNVSESGDGEKVKTELGRAERIELQIDADEDLLGEALRYIERSMLLRIAEEPIPLIVFMESPVKLRANAQKACSDYIDTAGEVTNCDNAPENIKTYIAKMEAYADHMEQVRLLRLQLARYAGEVLELQGKVSEPISRWIDENLDAYKQIIAEQQDIIRQALPSWNFAQYAFNEFNNVTNLPWCMHQGKTTPTYSLLDPWLPARSEGGSAKEATNSLSTSLPDLTTLDIPPPQDLIIDFSAIATIRDPIILPVLKPIQVRLNLPASPDELPDADELPDLPSMQPIEDLMANLTLPDVADTPPPPASSIPEPLGAEKIAEIGTTMDNIAFLVFNMNRTYEDFWESIGPLKPEDEWKESEREEFEKQRKRKTNLECFDWEEMPCIHVEMDLLERMTRIASRPLVFLREDYETVGTPRLTPNTCLAEDEACLRLHPELIPPKNRWEVIGPTEPLNDLEGLKRDVRNLTFPEDVGNMEPEDLPWYDVDLTELLPSIDTPPAMDLSPSES